MFYDRNHVNQICAINNDNYNENILFVHNIQIYITDLQ